MRIVKVRTTVRKIKGGFEVEQMNLEDGRVVHYLSRYEKRGYLTLADLNGTRDTEQPF